MAEAGSVGIATSEPFDMTGSMIRMLGGFLFCLGLFGAGIHFYKRYFMQSGGKIERRLKILERLPISTKNALLLVELDGRELLLATGPDSPKLLAAHSKRELSFDDTLLDAAAIGDEFNA
jgi:flagellar biogenesis protein FliO